MIGFQNEENEIRYAVWNINETTEELLLLAGTHYKKELEGIKREAGKRERLVARLLINHLCGEEKIVAYKNTGQPYLIDHSFHISISHTKGYVAVAVNPNRAIGIDIEYRSNRILKIKERFMLKEERLCAEKSPNELAYVLLCWCAKEAAYKKLEISTVDFFEELNCTIKGNALTVKYKEEIHPFSFLLNEDYCLVVG